MSGNICLYRRTSGIYAVRLVVPSNLRGPIGRGEICSSIGLRDMNAAKFFSSRVFHHWGERFMELATQDDNFPLIPRTRHNRLVLGSHYISHTDSL